MSTITTLQQKDGISTNARIVLSGATAENLIAALSDEFSRRILISTIAEGKTVQDISLEQAIPLSTCYRRARELVNQGLAVVERIVVTGDGKRYAVYRSSFRSMEVASDFTTITASVEMNEGVAERLRNRRLIMSYILQEPVMT